MSARESLRSSFEAQQEHLRAQLSIAALHNREAALLARRTPERHSCEAAAAAPGDSNREAALLARRTPKRHSGEAAGAAEAAGTDEETAVAAAAAAATAAAAAAAAAAAPGESS